MEVRPYQAEAFVRALTQPDWSWAYICWAMGAGKTALVHMLSAYWLREGTMHHGILMSPFATTRQAFVPASDSHRIFDFPEVTNRGERLLPPDLEALLLELVPDRRLVLPENAIRPIESDTTSELRRYLDMSNPGYFVSICNATIVRFEEWPEDMRGMVAVFDEFQQKGAPGLSAVSQLMASLGVDDEPEEERPTDAETRAQLDRMFDSLSKRSRRLTGVNLSATPFRANGVPVMPADINDRSVFVHYRSLVDQIVEGYAPRIQFTIRPLLVQGSTHQGRIDDLARQVVSLQQPGMKSVVRIKPRQGRGEDGRTNPRMVRDSLLAHGSELRIVDVTSYDPPENAALCHVASNQALEFLEHERTLNEFTESRADMMIGINVPITGMDWKFANTGIAIGLIKAVAALIQFVGRFTRLKDGVRGYPEQHARDSHVVFLVPVDPSNPLESFIEDQAGNLAVIVTKTALVLSQLTLPEAFKAYNDVRDCLYRILGATQDHVGPRQIRTDERARALQNLIRLRSLDGMTVGECRDAMLRGGASVDDANEAISQCLAAQEIQEDRARRLAALERNEEPIRQAVDPVTEAFRIIVEEFQAERVDFRNNPLLQGAFEVTTQFNETMPRQIAEQFRNLRAEFSADQVARWIHRAFESNKAYPTSGPIEEAPDISWEDVIRALQNGSYGLPKCNTLEEFYRAHLIRDLDFLTFRERCLNEDPRMVASQVEEFGLRWPGNRATRREEVRLFRCYITAFESMPRSLDRREILRQVVRELGLTSFLNFFRSRDPRRWGRGTEPRVFQGWSEIDRRIRSNQPVTLAMIRNLVAERSLDATV